MMDFQYQPLRDGQIRLLSLFPCSSANGFLQGSLDHVFLEECKSYCALSYTWGIFDNACAIQIHAQHHDSEAAPKSIIRLTSNLGAAMKRIRRSDEICRLWIDQICINQDDNDEKAVQVPLMSRIYGNAAQVIAWLGEEDDDTELAFNEFKRATQVLQEIHRDLLAASIITKDTSASEAETLVLSNWPLPFYMSGNWTAASNIFNRDFFQRVWIIQEIVLGRDVLVRCGSFTVDWAVLSSVARLQQFTLRSAPESTSIINSIRQDRHTRGTKIKPSDLMFYSSFFLATNHRDKLYGTFGLLEGPAPVVSYSATVEEVYVAATVHFIDVSSSLEVLCSKIGPGSDTLPSWVPDLRITSSILQRIESPSDLSEHLKTTDTLTFSASRDQLVVNGYLLAEIQCLGDTFYANEVSTAYHVQWMEMAYHAAEASGGCEFPRNYHRLLWANDEAVKPASPRYEQNIAGFDSWCFWMDYNYAKGTARYRGVEPSLKGWQEDFANRMVRQCTGRRAMLTIENELVLGPEDSQVGDVVCWLLGCPVPLLLRQAGRYVHVEGSIWTLVGACYFQNHMTCPLDEDGSKTRSFTLG